MQEGNFPIMTFKKTMIAFRGMYIPSKLKEYPQCGYEGVVRNNPIYDPNLEESL